MAIFVQKFNTVEGPSARNSVIQYDNNNNIISSIVNTVWYG